MKIFGSSLFQRRNGETSALGEFNYRVPSQRDTRPVQLEVDCFKKKKEFNDGTPCSTRRSFRKTKVESLKCDNDSDYGSMPREQEAELNYELENIRLQKPQQYFDLIPINRDVTYTEEDFSMFCDFDRVKVQLHPEEEWARNAKTVWWTIKFSRLLKNICVVTESSIGGSVVFSTEAKISFCHNKSVKITGTFDRPRNPDFELFLTTDLSKNEHRMGYFMAGCLKQGHVLCRNMETTHYATVLKDST